MIYAFVAFSSFVSAMTNATNELRAFKSLGNDLEMKYMIFMEKKVQRIAHKPKSGLKEQITESLPGAVTKVSTKLSFEVKPLQQWVCIQFAPPIGVQKKSCWMPLQG